MYYIKRILICFISLLIGHIIVFKVCIASSSLTRAIRFPVTNISKVINPRDLLFLSDAIISNQIYDTLYEFANGNVLRPRLAKRHVIKNNGLVFQIYINTNIRFSNKIKLDAKIVVSSLKKTIATFGESIRWGVGKIEGFSEFVKDPKKNDNVLGIKAISSEVVEIRLSTPFPLLLQILASPYFAIIHEQKGRRSGTGDYVISQIDDNLIKLKQITLNNQSALIPNEIIFLLVKDSNELNKMVQANEVDFFDISPDLKNIPKTYKIVSYNCLRSVFLYINTKNKKLRDPNVRCQLVKELSESFKKSKYSLSSAFKAFPFAWDLFSYGVNNRLNKVKLPPVDILWHSSGSAYFNEEYNLSVKNDLKKNGVIVNFNKQKVSDLVKKLKNGNFEAALVGWIPDYFDPDALLYSTLGRGQQYNFSGYNNYLMDKLLDQERSINDEQSRIPVFKNIFELLSKDCPVAFVGGQSSKYAITNSWDVTSISSLGFYHFRFRDLVKGEK